MAGFGKPLIMEGHGSRFSMINRPAPSAILLFRHLTQIQFMLAVVKVSSGLIFLSEMGCINQQTQGKHGRTLVWKMASRLAGLLLMQTMRTAFLLRCSGILMGQTPSAAFTEHWMAATHGNVFYILDR